MGKLLDYAEIAKLTAKIYTNEENNMTWEEARDKAISIYEGGENND